MAAHDDLVTAARGTVTNAGNRAVDVHGTVSTHSTPVDVRGTVAEGFEAVRDAFVAQLRTAR